MDLIKYKFSLKTINIHLYLFGNNVEMKSDKYKLCIQHLYSFKFTVSVYLSNTGDIK